MCVRPDGVEIARRRFGPLNLNGADAEAVEQTVREGLQWMCEHGPCPAICAGAAGISNPEAARALRGMFCQNGFDGELTLAGDHDIALRGAVGAIVNAGTGSICCGRNARGESARACGGGHLIDDEGSGYAIGRDILSAVLRALDGRAVPTLLSEAVARELGSATRERLVGYVYHESKGKADIARFASLLEAACDAGDAAALAIAQRAANELSELLFDVARRLALTGCDVALLGSVLEKCGPVRRETERRILEKMPEMNVIAPRADAATGAAMIAKEQWEETKHA